MARYISESDGIFGERESDFEWFVQVVKGRSIVSLAEQGPNVLEVGLSGDVMIRIRAEPKGWPGEPDEGFILTVVSTRNSTEPRSFALSLGEMPQGVPAWQLESKLRGLRTAFGILYLANSENRVLTQYLRQHPYGDLDRLLGDDGLQIESLSYGSWVAVLRSKGKQAVEAILALATIVFPRSRDALLKKLEAEAELKDIEAKRAAVALRRDEFELAKDQSNYIVDLVQRIGTKDEKQILRQRLRQALYELASGDRDEREIRSVVKRLLPSRESTDNTEK
jgi:hypothetical protein